MPYVVLLLYPLYFVDLLNKLNNPRVGVFLDNVGQNDILKY